jgi:Chaperone of endosialidase
VSSSNFGVYGVSGANNAVYGVATGTNAAVAGTSANGYAAYFEAGNGSGGFATCTFQAGTTNWACSSDRTLKDNFKAVNTAQVLEAVVKMPVTTWTMKGSAIRQMGPTAQDFHAAFNLGASDKSINNTDAQGVALAAIKGLNTKLETENAALKEALASLEARLAALEKAVRPR